MNSRVRSALKYIFSAILTLVFLYLAYRDTDVERLAQSLRQARYGWLLVMFAFLMVSHVLRAIRWGYLLDPIKHGIRFRNLFAGVMIGYLVNNFLPRAGELARPYALGRLESVSKSAAFGTIVVERVMDAISFLVLLVLIPAVYNGPLLEVFPWLEESGVLLSVVTGVFLAVVIAMVVRRDWTTRFVALIVRFLPHALAQKVDHLVHSFLDGFLFIKRPGNFLVIFFLSAGVWILYVAMMQAAFLAFDFGNQLGWRAAIVVLAISSIGVAMPTPGSTGGYHFFTSRALTGLFSVSEESALGYATLTHAVGFLGVTVVGLYFLFHDHIRVSEAVRSEEEGSQ